jgi:hypothetical protein
MKKETVIRKSKFDEVKEAHKSKSISLLIGMLPGG